MHAIPVHKPLDLNASHPFKNLLDSRRARSLALPTHAYQQLEARAVIFQSLHQLLTPASALS